MGNRKMESGQTIVEFALLLPIYLMLMLGFIDVSNWFIHQWNQDRATSVVAAYIAQYPEESLDSIVDRELDGCDYQVTKVDKILNVTATCPYSSLNRLYGFLPDHITSSEDVVPIQKTVPLPSASLVLPTHSPILPGESGE